MERTFKEGEQVTLQEKIGVSIVFSFIIFLIIQIIFITLLIRNQSIVNSHMMELKQNQYQIILLLSKDYPKINHLKVKRPKLKQEKDK